MYDFLDQMNQRQRWNFYMIIGMYTFYLIGALSVALIKNTFLPRLFMTVAFIPVILEVIYVANYRIKYVLRCHNCGRNVITGLDDDSLLKAHFNILRRYGIHLKWQIKFTWKYWLTKQALDFPEQCKHCGEPYKVRAHMKGAVGWLLDSRGILFVLGAFFAFGFGMGMISMLLQLLFRFL